MFVLPSEFYSYYQSSKCPLRIYLKHNGESPSTKPSPFVGILNKLGIAHEKAHLETFSSHVDLSKGSRQKRIENTIKEIDKGTSVIYHPLFKTTLNILGSEVDIIGEPDFLIKHEESYLIRDAKISRRIDEKTKPEIFRQLETYGLLFQKVIGKPCAGLQVLSGIGEIVDIPNLEIDETKNLLEKIVNIKSLGSEPYSPVGWSKCFGCEFKERCWKKAENIKDVALILGVDQNLAKALRSKGVRTVTEFLDTFDEEKLSEFKKPYGQRMQRVGIKAMEIMAMARSFVRTAEQ